MWKLSWPCQEFNPYRPIRRYTKWAMATSEDDGDHNNHNHNNNIIILYLLRAELNTQWIITESARIQTTSIWQHKKKRKSNKKTKENGSAKVSYNQTRVTRIENMYIFTNYISSTSRMLSLASPLPFISPITGQLRCARHSKLNRHSNLQKGLLMN
jgi:hypothetical protein